MLQECGLWYQEVEGRQGAGQGAGFKQTWDADGYLVMHMIHMPYADIKLSTYINKCISICVFAIDACLTNSMI